MESMSTQCGLHMSAHGVQRNMWGSVKYSVCHGYTVGWLFGHHTRTCEHRTCTATGTVSVGNGTVFHETHGVVASSRNSEDVAVV